jgi:hypothetical protein
MSTEHVTAMNHLLQDSAEIRQMCGNLDRDYLVLYSLGGGPAGATVFWQVHFSRSAGLTFELGAPSDPADVTIKGDYHAMVRATKATREGRKLDNPTTMEGDPTVLQKVSEVLAAARRVATVDVRFPE